MTDALRRPRPDTPPDLPAPPPQRSEHLLKVLLAAAVVLGAFALAAFAYGYAAHRTADTANAGQAKVSSQAGQLYSQAASAGITPTVTPPGASPASVIAGPTGAQGSPGSRGPQGPALTNAQAVAAVRVVCSSTTLCKEPVSIAALTTAVRTCFSTDQCPAPKNGSDGKDAPAVNNQQIIAALGSYCGADSKPCVGPVGPSGPAGTSGADGKDGADAPTITAVDCSGPLLTTGLQFTYHFSNGVNLVATCTAAAGTPTDTPTGAPTS